MPSVFIGPSNIFAYYQYNQVISALGEALFIVSEPKGKFDPVVGSQLQLLTVSLADIDFPQLKGKLSEIASYYAAQCSNGEKVDFKQVLQYIDDLTNYQDALKLSYEEEALDEKVIFGRAQLDFVFDDQPPVTNSVGTVTTV
jgi:hypothetical protein